MDLTKKQSKKLIAISLICSIILLSFFCFLIVCEMNEVQNGLKTNKHKKTLDDGQRNN